MGIIQVSQSAPDTTEEVADNKQGVTDSTGEKSAETDDKKVNITLDGPLSQIYTQALNIAYAKEGTDDMIVNVTSKIAGDAGNAYVGGNSDDKPVEDESIYVYATSSEALEEYGCNRAIGCITKVAKKKGKRAVLVIEHHGKVGGTMGLLDTYASDIGMTVCYSRDTAMDIVRRLSAKK